MTPNKLMTIVVLAAVLIAGIGAIALLQFSSAPASTPDTTIPSASSLPGTATSSSGFNTAVLQRSDYTALDLGMITQGRLPVQAPASAGKPNPFQ